MPNKVVGEFTYYSITDISSFFYFFTTLLKPLSLVRHTIQRVKVLVNIVFSLFDEVCKDCTVVFLSTNKSILIVCFPRRIRGFEDIRLCLRFLEKGERF